MTDVTVKCSDQQELFAQNYIIDMDATASTINAGYAKKHASKQGYILKNKPHIKARIRELFAEKYERLDISAERVLSEYARIAFFDTRKLFDEDGRPIPINKLDADTAAAIHSFKMTETKDLKRTWEIKVNDKRAALDSISKTFGTFIQKTELTGADGEPLDLKPDAFDLAKRIAFALRTGQEGK